MDDLTKEGAADRAKSWASRKANCSDWLKGRQFSCRSSEGIGVVRHPSLFRLSRRCPILFVSTLRDDPQGAVREASADFAVSP
jgi:hypothetical protein